MIRPASRIPIFPVITSQYPTVMMIKYDKTNERGGGRGLEGSFYPSMQMDQTLRIYYVVAIKQTG